MTLYKLTTQEGTTRPGRYNETYWGPGVTNKAVGGVGKQLCTSNVIHAYESPLLAFLLNPLHARIKNPRLWEAKGEIIAREGQLKCGCRKLTTTKEILAPKITGKQRVRFAIGCAVLVYKKADFLAWATAWLGGTDRTLCSATRVLQKVSMGNKRWGAADGAQPATLAVTAAMRLAPGAPVQGQKEAVETRVAVTARAAAHVAKRLNLKAVAEWAMTEEGLQALEGVR